MITSPDICIHTLSDDLHQTYKNIQKSIDKHYQICTIEGARKMNESSPYFSTICIPTQLPAVCELDAMSISASVDLAIFCP